jgi:hypothetical protein
MKFFRVLLVLVVMALALGLAPAAVKADAFPGYTSGIQIQNLDPADATATLTFYNADGSIRDAVPATIPGGKSATFVSMPLTTTDPFSGSLVISSDKPLAVYANVMNSALSARGSYVGSSTGSTTVKLPLLMKNNGSSSHWTTNFSVQNAGTGSANVTVTYTDACGAQTPVAVAEGASHKFDQGAEACHNLPIFGATVTSTNPIVAVVMQESSLRTAISAWTGFGTAGSPDLKIPLVNVQPSRLWATGIQVFNVGGSATTLKLTYLDQDGVTSCTETQTLPANGTTTYALAAFVSGGTGITTTCNNKTLIGTAFIATPADNSAGMPLLAVVNQTKFTATTNYSGAYNAFSSADGTAQVTFPLIMDRNGSRQWQTGFNIMNVGTAQAFVKCTFSNSTYTVQKVINVNQAVNDVQGTKIAASYVGSATCLTYTDATYTTVNKTGKIVAVLNQTANVPASPAEKDLLLTDEGVNSVVP